MANNRKVVINVHSSENKAPTGDILNYGEIAVSHSSKENAALYTKISDDVVAKFISEDAINGRISGYTDSKFNDLAGIVQGLANLTITDIKATTPINATEKALVAESCGNTVTISHVANKTAQSGFKKLTTDTYGHVTGGENVVIGDISGLDGFDEAIKGAETKLAYSSAGTGNAVTSISVNDHTITANFGKEFSEAGHKHDGSDITGGTVGIGHLPTSKTVDSSSDDTTIPTSKAVYDAVSGTVNGLKKEASSSQGQFVRTVIQKNGLVSESKDFINVNDVKLSAVTPSSTTVKEEYALYNGNGAQLGDRIKIYKDQSLVSITLEDNDGSGKTGQYLKYTYIDVNGDRQSTYVNISSLLVEAEFKDGLVVNENGEVRVKIDPTSEVFLTVSSEGIKVSGLQNAINTAVAAEVARATAAEDSISANVTTLSSTTETFSASTVAKFEVMESGWNVPGSIKHTIEDAFVKSVAVGSSEDSNKSLMRYYNDGDEHKYYVSSSANDMYYNGLPLSTVIKNIKDEITQSSNDTDELSAATISEVARLDRRINDETTRATAAENSISGTVNTLSAATESEIERIEGKLSDNERVTSEAINQLKDEIDKTQEGAGLNEDGSYHKHNTVGDMANYITNATSLDNADMMLDSALKAESDRAIASEESISGIVNTFSATTESTIKNLQEQLTEANSIIETLRTEIQTLSGVVETIESQMAVNIYSTVRAMLQGASKQIKVTPDDDSKQINIGFADDAIFGQ